MSIGISEAVELTRTIAELAKKGFTIELQERIMELREAVLNARDEALSLREENSALHQALHARSDLAYDKGLENYWLGTGEQRDGPFCARCYDADGKMIRVQLSEGPFGKWACPVCHNYSGPSSPHKAVGTIRM